MDVDEGLRAYAGLVREWAGRINLVAEGDLERFEERHVQDSLRALEVLDSLPAGPCIDVGSGAGLPGVPLAIARPERAWTLVEPRQKRAAFLELVVREVGIDAAVVTVSAQEAAAGPLAGSGVAVTARALAAPEEAVRLVRPLVARGGAGILFLGEGTEPPEGAAAGPPGLAIISR